MGGLFNNPDFLAYLCGAAAAAVVVLIWMALIERDPLEGRLKAVTDRRNEFEAAQKQRPSRRIGLRRISLMKRIVSWFKLSQGKGLAALRLKLKRAGIFSRDAMVVFMFSKLALLVGMAVAAIVFIFVLKVGKLAPATGMLACLVAGVIGWSLPDVLLKNMSQKREQTLRRGIPDALDLMVICAEAGLSLDSALDRVCKEIGASYPELAEEIGLTSVELNFLPDRHMALRGLSDRVPLPGVIALVNTLIQTERYGTPLAQALRVLSSEMREERMMKSEEKAAKLPAILTVPMILFILPPLFVVLIGPAILKVMDAMKGVNR